MYNFLQILNMGFFSQFVYSMLIFILSFPFYSMLVVMLPMSILICTFSMLKEKKASKIMILDTTALENNPMSLDLWGTSCPREWLLIFAINSFSKWWMLFKILRGSTFVQWLMRDFHKIPVYKMALFCRVLAS